MNSSRADKVLFGFEFQVYAGLYLMLKFPHEFENIKIEGDEDIEILLADTTRLFAQAKSFTKPYDSKNSYIKNRFEKGLETLSKVKCGVNDKLIYISNMPDRPLGIEHNQFGEEYYYHFEELSKDNKDTILSIIKKANLTIDTGKLIVAGFPFYGEDPEQKCRAVLGKLRELLVGIDSRLYSMAPRILKYWASCLLDNGAEGDKNKTIEKRRMIWDLIAFCLVATGNNDKLLVEAGFDELKVYEASNLYEEFIHMKENQFPDYNRIILLKEKYSTGDYRVASIGDFVKDKSEEIKDIIFPKGTESKIDQNLRETCAALIACHILLKKSTITKILKEME